MPFMTELVLKTIVLFLLTIAYAKMGIEPLTPLEEQIIISGIGEE